jgi:hypothetical protein
MFNEIKNDWKNYKHDIENPVITEPIFKWQKKAGRSPLPGYSPKVISP